MEATEGNNNSGFTVRGDEAPDSYRLAPRSEKHDQSRGSNMAAPALIYTPVSLGTDVLMKKKKKRGRPRKYDQDGTRIAISPMPISAAVPLGGGGDYSSSASAWKQDRPVVDPFKKKKAKLDFGFGNIGGDGQGMPYSFSANFTPHVLTVNTGEDVSMRIISFSQQSSRAICILAANGAVSNVTLRQHNSSGGTMTYEGMFEILSLTGSFMATDDGVTKSRSGGMSICLAGPDGRVFGGGLAGLLVAAVPVQVVIGSFLSGNNQVEEKEKKQKSEFTINYSTSVQTNHNASSGNGTEGSFSIPRPNQTPHSSYHGTDVINPTPLNSRPISNSTAPNIISFGREESENCKISC
ncbi:AT-hook motif nuclear-localized protein 7-like [Impatiens glandulifera]|uniref:AT-hook motif nuclear-localized protein 7-like n=1 Tax=Impatiens glandulifera TaxID=253017 RepID=UPI001FB073EE|nr:AT-hook motif nuclear-localized protein 7-like [Impatiens glandulifera]